ncbi:MAG: hypothetical protein HRU15_13895 [Planctomycetes bacterium]|nr:hypothetical protein [Planctomycetota bacterium]
MYTGIVTLFDVSNMDESIDFYVNKLGFHIDCSWAPEDKILWCKLDMGDCKVMLQQSESPE